jgi:transposase
MEMMAFSLSIRLEVCSMVVMATRYIINLTEDERFALEDLSSRKRVSKLKAQRAQILLKADEGITDTEVADELGVGTATVERIRKRAVLEGIEAALDRRRQQRISRPPKLDGRGEAHLVRLACSDPPDGFARWTLTLLADKLVELEVVDSISRTTIHRRLKKTTSNHGR